jgi:CBS domain-containing protein
MFKEISVGDIMTRNLITVDPDTSLYDCAKTLVKNRIDTLLVTDNNKLKGILTARDILWAITKKPGVNLNKVKIIDIAKRKVAVIKPSADLNQAFQKMKKHGFKRLPVLLRGQVVGVLTVKDILRIDPSVYRQMGDWSDVREEARKIREMDVVEEDMVDGRCDECNEYEQLKRIEGQLLCPSCQDSLL